MGSNCTELYLNMLAFNMFSFSINLSEATFVGLNVNKMQFFGGKFVFPSFSEAENH